MGEFEKYPFENESVLKMERMITLLYGYFGEGGRTHLAPPAIPPTFAGWIVFFSLG